MLFSNDRVARLLNENFECAWESVRPVPRVEIDFGNGHRLERTVNGNIATYFCTPEGKVFDLLPGLVTPKEFCSRAGLAVDLYGQIARRPDASSILKTYHSTMQPVASDPERVRKTAEDYKRTSDMMKARVESRLKVAAMLEAHAQRFAIADHAKKKVEEPVKELEEDTKYNQVHRYPKVHELLSKQPLAAPTELTKTVYKDILHTDLDDPYLGLAPNVLGGEGGRHHD